MMVATGGLRFPNMNKEAKAVSMYGPILIGRSKALVCWTKVLSLLYAQYLPKPELAALLGLMSEIALH